MKQLATPEDTFEITQRVKSSQGHSFTQAFYVDDNGDDILFEDLQYPINIKKDTQPPIYANVNYEPAVASGSFNVINEQGIYSPKNTGSTLNDILVRDRVFKFFDLQKTRLVKPEQCEEILLLGSFLYFTKLDPSNDVILDIANASGNTEDFFNDLFDTDYDSEFYDDSEYDPQGYFIKTTDRGNNKIERWTKIKVTANSVDGDIYWRAGNSEKDLNAQASDTTSWNFAGATINGVKTVTISIKNAKTLQVAVVYRAALWSDPIKVSNIELCFVPLVEKILLATLFLDDPNFKERASPSLSVIKVTGRNAYKRALETKINIKDLSLEDGGSGQLLQDFIKDVATAAKITFTASSIADLTSFGRRTNNLVYEEEVSINVIFTDIMMIIGRTFRMFIDDSNVLFVQLRPTEFLASWVFDFRNYIKADQKFVGERQLQRFTILTDQQVLDATVILDTDTFTTAGSKSLTWAGKAIVKVLSITANTGFTVSNVKYLNTSATFDLTGSGSITLQITGNRFKSMDSKFIGEAVDFTNLQAGDGFTIREINPLIISDTEAKDRAEDYISEFGKPEFNVTIRDAYSNPLPEINDFVLLVSQDFFEDTLYEQIGTEFDYKSEVDKHTIFKLLDTGKKFTDEGAIIYDRDFFDSSVPKIQHDIGHIYDSDEKIGITREELEAKQTFIEDLDF